MEKYFVAFVWLLMVWLAFGAWRLRRKRVRPGPAAAAMMHEILNEDRRAAVEIILEQRAPYHDPESRDGDAPDSQPRNSRRNRRHG